LATPGDGLSGPDVVGVDPAEAIATAEAQDPGAGPPGPQAEKVAVLSRSPNGEVKGRKKSSAIADDLPNSVADAPTQSTQLTQCTAVETPSPIGQSDLHKRVEELLSTVRSQQETIHFVSKA